jgi:hypothetical protein
MSRLTLPAFLLGVLLSTSALALSKEVRQYLNSATALYENLEYEKALGQLGRAKAKSTGAEDDTAIALFEGILLAEQGKQEAALTAFKTGLSLNRSAKLPLEVSPKVEEIFRRARENVDKLLGPVVVEEPPKPPPVEVVPPKVEPAPAPVVDVKQNEPPGYRKVAWIPGAVGLGLAGAGTYLLFQAQKNHDALVNGTVPPEDAESVREEGKRQQLLGGIALGVGAAGIVATVVMYVASSGDDAPAPTVWLTPGGAGLAVGGQF